MAEQSGDIRAAEAFERAYLAKLSPNDIEAIAATADAVENSPAVQRARAEVQRHVKAIREDWTRKYGAEYPQDRNDVERLAVRAGVPAEVLFGAWDHRDNWRIWNAIEGYLLRLQDIERTGDPAMEGNGPLSGNRFRFAGKCHEMRPISWKLLYALWDHNTRDMHDVEDEVWDVAGGSQLTDALHDLKAFLKGVGYPRYVSKARRSDSLVWKAF